MIPDKHVEKLRRFAASEGIHTIVDNENIGAEVESRISKTQKQIDRGLREAGINQAEGKKGIDRFSKLLGGLNVEANPHAREIQENLRLKYQTPDDIICPKCKDTDHGNKMNKTPWCMKCNLPLMKREKAKDWVEPLKPKKSPKIFGEPDEVCRIRSRRTRVATSKNKRRSR